MNGLDKIWKVELDLLKEFDTVCKKHGIQYYASCGTLLGAARHKGFIPWDDDVDLFLMWPDYQRLMQIAQEEFRYPYFYQSIYSEPEAMPNACRLRRSDTTGFTKWEFENTGSDYNKGIFIDIFPLFYVPESIQERDEQKRSVLKLWEIIRGHDAWKMREKGYSGPNIYEKYIPTFLSYCQKNGGIPSITKLKEDYLLACSSVSERTPELGATSSKCHQSNLMWNTEWFDEVVYLPFEDTCIPCPSEYEKVLEKQYGDWRVPVQGSAMHEMFIADADLPWRQYSFLSQLNKKEI